VVQVALDNSSRRNRINFDRYFRRFVNNGMIETDAQPRTAMHSHAQPRGDYG